MLRRLVLIALMGSATVYSPALAREGSAYVGFSGGWMKLQPITYTSVPNFGRVRSRGGFDLAGVAGYDFGIFRAEGELSYKRASADTVDVGAGPIPLAGKTSEFSAMANGLFNIRVAPRFSLAAGGGVGAAWVHPNYSAAGLTTTGSGTKFAWQLIGEARLALSDSVDVGVEYRYHNVDNIRSSGSGINATGNLRSHSVLASLYFNFP